MKRRQTLPDYGVSHGKCPKGFRLRNYPAVKRSIESQVPAIFMYRMRHVFSCLVPVSSLCRRRLAYILYESWLLGVFRIYTTLKPRSSEVCSAFISGHIRCKLPLTSILGSYIHGIHRVTMIYILHIYTHYHGKLQLALCCNACVPYCKPT